MPRRLRLRRAALNFLTDCNFRKMPQATTYEEEISAEPWFSCNVRMILLRKNSLKLSPSELLLRSSNGMAMFHVDFWQQQVSRR